MIGRLDQKVLIERQVFLPDGAGGRDLSWVPVPVDPEPWAKVVLGGGAESVDQATQQAVFTIRARSDLKSADRIRWGGMIWNIEAIGRPVARSKFQEISATSGELSA